jgi:aminoglycoside phosphotransferase (APT) family kinase protein
MQSFTGTKPVAASHAFDVQALQVWLQNHVADFAGPLSVEQFKGGQSNPTYLLKTPDRAYVMRSKPGPVARLLPSAHAIEREYRVMKALRDTAVPVAQMAALCEDESVIGRAFYIMAYVEGRVLWDQSLPGIALGERAAYYDEMNRVIAALHAVDPATVGLGDYGKPGSYFERQIGRWTKQYLASVTEPIEAMDRLIEWLPTHLPASALDNSRPSIVHGDYRLDNVIFHPTEARILAVLDWELSTLGHPLADFSYHCMSWHIPPGAASAGTTWRHCRFRRRPITSSAMSSGCRAASTLSPWRQTGTSIWPTTCSASQPFCKASPVGWWTERRPARRPARQEPARGLWPNWAGHLRNGPETADPASSGSNRSTSWTLATHPAHRPCVNALMPSCKNMSFRPKRGGGPNWRPIPRPASAGRR